MRPLPEQIRAAEARKWNLSLRTEAVLWLVSALVSAGLSDLSYVVFHTVLTLGVVLMVLAGVSVYFFIRLVNIIFSKYD
jgi:hypothetical protein